MRYAYPCVLAAEQERGFSVSFPDVPEALTCGDDRAEALEMAEDALAVALGAYVQSREEIPVPGSPEPGQVMVAVHIRQVERGLRKVGRRLVVEDGAV